MAESYNSASVPPAPGLATVPPKNASKESGGGARGNGGSGGGSVASKLDKMMKMMNFGLLAWIALGWLSWIIFLAGISAITDTANDLIDSDSVQNDYGFAWFLLWAWFFILLALTVATVASLSAKTRHVASVTSRGMLFFLAIFISWLGVEAHRATVDNRRLKGFGSVESRASTLLAGEIMTLIAAFLIAITLLLMDQARTHSGSDAAKRHSNVGDAAAASVGGGPVGTHGGPHTGGQSVV